MSINPNDQWLIRFTSTTRPGSLERWVLRLQQYNLNIRYAPGKTNVIADGLSRPLDE